MQRSVVWPLQRCKGQTTVTTTCAPSVNRTVVMFVWGICLNTCFPQLSMTDMHWYIFLHDEQCLKWKKCLDAPTQDLIFALLPSFQASLPPLLDPESLTGGVNSFLSIPPTTVPSFHLEAASLTTARRSGVFFDTYIGGVDLITHFITHMPSVSPGCMLH